MKIRAETVGLLHNGTHGQELSGGGEDKNSACLTSWPRG
jgi:hypothetical protein